MAITNYLEYKLPIVIGFCLFYIGVFVFFVEPHMGFACFAFWIVGLIFFAHTNFSMRIANVPREDFKKMYIYFIISLIILIVIIFIILYFNIGQMVDLDTG